jgi:hypothetical protein
MPSSESPLVCEGGGVVVIPLSIHTAPNQARLFYILNVIILSNQNKYIGYY